MVFNRRSHRQPWSPFLWLFLGNCIGLIKSEHNLTGLQQLFKVVLAFVFKSVLVSRKRSQNLSKNLSSHDGGVLIKTCALNVFEPPLQLLDGLSLGDESEGAGLFIVVRSHHFVRRLVAQLQDVVPNHLVVAQ